MMKPILRLTFWRLVLAALVVFGVYAVIVRFTQGLGGATNLTDAFPWGLWVGFDVMVGVGLAAGGFTLAATVHVFHIERYHEIARPAVFTAFVGYLLVVVGLFFDLGRPWAIWHPLIMWNPHSVMFEVAWCVTLYTSVLALEFSPIVLERFGMHRPLRWVRAIYVPLVVVGVLLSMLHQSSLGTLYLIVPNKLYPLWYTPWLPVFFFLSAVAAGLAMTIVESYLSHRAFGRALEKELLEGLARVMVVILSVFALWKLLDLHLRGHLGLVFQVTPESVMFWGEMALGVVVPLVMMSFDRLRKSQQGLFLAALLTVMGFVLGRLNIAITGMARASGTTYVPSAIEAGVTLMLIALGFAAFALAGRHLRLFPEESHADPESAEGESASAAPAPARTPLTSVWGVAGLWALLLVGAGLLHVAGKKSATVPVAAAGIVDVGAKAGKSSAAVELKYPEEIVFHDQRSSPGPVTFRHDSHVDNDKPNCIVCHRSEFSLLGKAGGKRKPITMANIRAGKQCGLCHNGKTAFGTGPDDCGNCHER